MSLPGCGRCPQFHEQSYYLAPSVQVVAIWLACHGLSWLLMGTYWPCRVVRLSWQALLARIGVTADLPADEAAYAPNTPRTVQAGMAFQGLRAPLTVLLGLGLRVSVGGDQPFKEDLDRLKAGIEGLGAVNPFALAWSQALPNIVNLVSCLRPRQASRSPCLSGE